MKTTRDPNKPRILVVLATLGKRNDYLRLALESIRSQNVENIDIVMVYPLNNKETSELAKKYDAVSLPDPGDMSSAVNIGIIYGWDTHDYVIWAGDDDLLLPGSLEMSRDALEKAPESSASFGYCQYIGKDGEPLFLSKAGAFAPLIAPWGPNLIPMPGSMLRMDSLKKLDYILDPSLKFAMDLDLFLRLKKVGKLIAIPKPVSAFRWHPGSTTVASKHISLLETERVKRRYLPSYLRPIAPVWELPVRAASKIASSKVSSRSRKKGSS